MYADPTKIRDNVVKVRLNDAESQLLDALVAYTGEQKATLIRELLLEQARHVLFGEKNFATLEHWNEVHDSALQVS